MLCLRTRYFTSFCQRMLLYEVTTFLKHRRSWNWGCRRHKSWICCTWGRHLRNDRGKQNCRSLVVADHERKSQTSKQEDTVSMWSWLCILCICLRTKPFEDFTRLCCALHLQLCTLHCCRIIGDLFRSSPIKSYHERGPAGRLAKWGDLAKSSPPPPAQTWMTKDTNEELRKNQARTKRWNQRSVVSTQSAQSRWNPSVLMSSWMSSWPIQSSNKTWFRGQDQDVICQMANGIVSLAWVISSLLGVFWVFLNIYFHCRTFRWQIKNCKTDILGRWAERTRSWRSPWRNMCLLLAAGQSTALSFSQVLKNIEEIPSSQVKFEFAKFHLWGHGPRVAMCSWFQVLPQARHVWNCVDHWST